MNAARSLQNNRKEKMKKITLRRRYITLVEMMIVMFLIAMITGVIAYNYSGSLEEGKAFKTKAGIEKIRTVLDLHFATHPEDKDNVDSRWKQYLEDSQLVKNAAELQKDGWGNEYTVSVDHAGEIEITSQKYNSYLQKNSSMFGQKEKSHK